MLIEDFQHTVIGGRGQAAIWFSQIVRRRHELPEKLHEAAGYTDAEPPHEELPE